MSVEGTTAVLEPYACSSPSVLEGAERFRRTVTLFWPLPSGRMTARRAQLGHRLRFDLSSPFTRH